MTRTPLAIFLASVLFPPLGLALLLLRPQTGYVKKAFGTLGIAILGVAHLFLFWGLRAELDGSGKWFVFTFHNPEKHYHRLEQTRAAMAEERAPAAPEVVQAAAPEPAPEPAPTPPAKPATPPYWTDYRGPARDGLYAQTPILTDWPAQGLDRLWRLPVGGGYASFVAANGKIYTIEQRRTREVVAAYDLETGKELWTNSWEGLFREALGGDGPRATPTWHEGRIYALGALGELRCLDAESGKVIWSKNILRDNGAENITWGMAAAPLIVDEKVIVQPGGPNGKSIVAYHKLTGARVWSSLDDKAGYASPMLVTLAGVRQIVTMTGVRAVAVSPDDGRLLWEYPWRTAYDINSAQPIVTGPNRVVISSGYGHGAALLEIEKSHESLSARPVWENTSMKNKFNSSVLYEGHIYGLDEGILACVEVETGRRTWKGGRYGYGQLLLAEGHLIVLTEGGDVVLVKANPERHEELARFSAIEGKTWNTPAIVDGKLLVRNETQMACFRLARN
ncbi:MAG: PQQ-binding-like beta-propeller repeat protein [Bryobacteraceae bacterium]